MNTQPVAIALLALLFNVFIMSITTWLMDKGLVAWFVNSSIVGVSSGFLFLTLVQSKKIALWLKSFILAVWCQIVGWAIAITFSKFPLV